MRNKHGVLSMAAAILILFSLLSIVHGQSIGPAAIDVAGRPPGDGTPLYTQSTTIDPIAGVLKSGITVTITQGLGPAPTRRAWGVYFDPLAGGHLTNVDFAIPAGSELQICVWDVDPKAGERGWIIGGLVLPPLNERWQCGNWYLGTLHVATDDSGILAGWVRPQTATATPTVTATQTQTPLPPTETATATATPGGGGGGGGTATGTPTETGTATPTQTPGGTIPPPPTETATSTETPGGTIPPPPTETPGGTIPPPPTETPGGTIPPPAVSVRSVEASATCSVPSASKTGQFVFALEADADISTAFEYCYRIGDQTQAPNCGGANSFTDKISFRRIVPFALPPGPTIVRAWLTIWHGSTVIRRVDSGPKACNDPTGIICPPAGCEDPAIDRNTYLPWVINQ